MSDRSSIDMDKTLIRHLYDLHHIYKANKIDEVFISLLKKIVLTDKYLSKSYECGYRYFLFQKIFSRPMQNRAFFASLYPHYLNPWFTLMLYAFFLNNPELGTVKRYRAFIGHPDDIKQGLKVGKTF